MRFLTGWMCASNRRNFRASFRRRSPRNEHQRRNGGGRRQSAGTAAILAGCAGAGSRPGHKSGGARIGGDGKSRAGSRAEGRRDLVGGSSCVGGGREIRAGFFQSRGTRGGVL